MPNFFHKHLGRWQIERVPDPLGVLSLAPVRWERVRESDEPPEHACLLVRGTGDGAWVLITALDQCVLHNGARITSGLRVLAHRDSLALAGGETVYFSTEEAAQIEPFVGASGAICPRCRGEIRPGQAAVRCPGCGVFHHEIAGHRNCWSYAPSCALCPQPTALDTGLQWSPETL